MVAVLDRASTYYIGINPPTGDYDLLDNQPAINGVVLTKDTTKEDLDLDEVFQYRGQVETYSKLPKTGLHRGDTYNVADTGENYAYNGSSWDLLTGFEAVYWRNGKLQSQGNDLTIDSDKNPITNLILEDITDITATKNEVNQLHEGTAVKADFIKLHSITADASELNILDGATLDTTELNYVDGVTSNIQTQLNGKQPNITGAATTITSSNLTKNRAVISNNSGKIAISDTTSTELGYVHGVTSAIQTQLNNKVEKNDDITGSTKCKITYDSKGLVTSGADLEASDIPSLNLTKISDVSATSTEVNYLSGVTSAIQNQLNGKEPTISDLETIRTGAGKGDTALQPNPAITGATKCKITYDTNGLVTAGDDLSAGDIPDISGTYQTVISDLETIRSGASKGETSVQTSSGSSAPDTSTEGVLGSIYIDTTTQTGYMCVGVDTETPEYTWKQITA